MNIPVNDLSRETASMRAGLDAAAARVLDRGWFLMGPELPAFEEAFSRYLGAEHCIAVANGTDALEVTLRTVGLAPGDGVIVSPNAGMYGVVAAVQVGAEPIFADVADDRLCMTAESLERAAAGARAKAVIVTHLYGQLADMPSILAAAKRHDLIVIEDCAQAHGARLDGRFGGTFADIACFSFYPTKNLGALGDAGAIVTRRPDYAETARLLRQYGWRGGKYRVDLARGRNSRMDELQAAFLLAKLPHLDSRNARRKEIWKYYRDSVGERLRLVGSPGDDFIAHLCVARSSERDALRQRLSERGIATDVHYPIPDHRQPVWGEKYSPVSMPVSERACREVYTLPCFPEMTDAEIDHVAGSLKQSL
jgi:aminotransferase EvaB